MALSSSGFAQVLAEPHPVDRLSSVTQFGLPNDAEFVLCDQEACPQRSAKHLARKSPAPREPKVLSSQQVRRIQVLELSPAKSQASGMSSSEKVPMASDTQQE